MKSAVLILSFLLSWLFNGGAGAEKNPRPAIADVLVEAAAQDNPQASKDYNTLCLTSARGESYSGEDHVSSPTVRSVGSSRRIQSSARFSSRIIKDGKVIDRHFFESFLMTLFCSPSGRFCIDRYIYSIHYLRI